MKKDRNPARPRMLATGAKGIVIVGTGLTLGALTGYLQAQAIADPAPAGVPGTTAPGASDQTQSDTPAPITVAPTPDQPPAPATAPQMAPPATTSMQS